MGHWIINKPKGATKEVEMYHQTTVLGRIGQAIEVKATSSGAKVGKFSLAVSERFKGESKTTWYRCTAFNRQAEVLEEYTCKGGRILVTGRMEFGEFSKQDGTKVNTADLIVNNVQIVDFKEQGEAKPQIYHEASFTSEDIPF